MTQSTQLTEQELEHVAGGTTKEERKAKKAKRKAEKADKKREKNKENLHDDYCSVWSNKIYCGDAEHFEDLYGS